MKLKKLASTMALGLGLGVMAVPAYSGDLYFFEDDDLEWVLRSDGDGGYVTVTQGLLQVGDVLFSVFEIPTFEINGTNAIPTGDELTGVAAIQVSGFNETSGTFTFDAWSDLTDFVPSLTYDGAIVGMWLNDLTPDVDLVGENTSELSCSTLTGCISQVTEGTLFQVDGFAGDPDELWTATLLESPFLEDIKAGASTDQYIAFRGRLSNLFNAWGPIGYINTGNGLECTTFDPTNPAGDGCVQFRLSGAVYGGVGFEDTDIVARSDFQARKYTQVPEPGTLALLGMGLLGLGATMRRRKA